MKQKLAVTGLMVIFFIHTFAGNPADSSKVRTGRLIAVCSTVPVVTASVAVYLNNVWWKPYGTGKFQFNDKLEMKYALKLDKCGHFWSSSITTEVFSGLLQWAGVNKSTSLWCGAGFGILMSGIVEVKDGFSPWWGFSLTDMTANTLGSIYPLLQHKVPFFDNIHFKWCWDFNHKSQHSEIYALTHPDKKLDFMDDYERHTYWMSVDVCNMFFKNYKGYLPRFLDLGIGFSMLS